MRDVATKPIDPSSRHGSAVGSDKSKNSQYTYSSYVTFGTYDQSSNSANSSNNNGSNIEPSFIKRRIRVKVRRKRDENGNYLPHKHEHSHENSLHKKHRVLKHKDGVIASYKIYTPSNDNEALRPLTTCDVTAFDFDLSITVGTSTLTMNEGENTHKRHRNNNREKHKWASKKRKEAWLSAHPPQSKAFEDHTFTGLGGDEPQNINGKSRFRNPNFSSAEHLEAGETFIDTMQLESYGGDTAPTRLPREAVFPSRKDERKVEMVSVGVQPVQRQFNPMKFKKLKELVEKVSDHLYPMNRRPPKSVKLVNKANSAYGDDNYQNDPVMCKLLSPQAVEEAEMKTFKAPEGEYRDLKPEQRNYADISSYLHTRGQHEEPVNYIVPEPKKISTRPHSTDTRFGTEANTHDTKASPHLNTDNYEEEYEEEEEGEEEEEEEEEEDVEHNSAPLEEYHFTKSDQLPSKGSIKASDHLTSVEFLVSADSKSGEFVQVSGSQRGVAFIEQSTYGTSNFDATQHVEDD